MAKEQKKPVYKQWWFWVIIAVVVIGIGAGGLNQNKNNDNGNQTSEAGQTKEEPKEEADPVYFDEIEMEEFCQEDHMADIQGYFDSVGRDVAVIYTTNYNKYFKADYSKTTDGSDRPVALLSWNGKDRATNQPVSFMCWATKVDGEKELLLLDIDNQVVRGSLTAVYGEE